MNARVLRVIVLSTTPGVSWGCGTWVVAGGAGGSSGPGVLARCWALRNQARVLLREGWVGWVFLCLLSPLPASGWWVGLVGVVFDMWIVDASIWRQPLVGCCLLFL